MASVTRDKTEFYWTNFVSRMHNKEVCLKRDVYVLRSARLKHQKYVKPDSAKKYTLEGLSFVGATDHRNLVP